MNTWTPVAKPTGNTYTTVNPQGKETYDQVSLTYDSATTYYDGINPSQWTGANNPVDGDWTNVFKPGPIPVQVIDNFDSYTNGTLNGQGSWTADPEYVVQSSYVYQGIRAVSTPDTVFGSMSKAITPITKNGTLAAYMQESDSNNGAMDMVLSNTGATQSTTINLGEGGTMTIATSSGGLASNFTIYTSAVWTQVGIEFDFDNGLLRGVSDGVMSPWIPTNMTDIASMVITTYPDAGVGLNCYVDYITFTPS